MAQAAGGGVPGWEGVNGPGCCWWVPGWEGVNDPGCWWRGAWLGGCEWPRLLVEGCLVGRVSMAQAAGGGVPGWEGVNGPGC